MSNELTNKRIKDSILSLKHWQVILVLMVCTMAFSSLADIVASFFDWEWGSIPYKSIDFALTTTLFFVYPVVVGRRLMERISGSTTESLPIYTRSVLVYAVFVSNYCLGLYIRDVNVVVQGMLVLVHLGCTVLNSIGAARTLAIAENGWNVKFSDYSGNLVLFALWPVGVFVLQPRINKFAEVKVEV